MNNILEIEGLSFRYEDRNVLEILICKFRRELFRFSWPEWFWEINFAKMFIRRFKAKTGKYSFVWC